MLQVLKLFFAEERKVSAEDEISSAKKGRQARLSVLELLLSQNTTITQNSNSQPISSFIDSMPPRPCLRGLPLRVRDSTNLSASSRDARWLPMPLQSATFSTSAPYAHPMPAKKKVSTEGPPKKGVRALRIKKKDRVVRDAKPPAPGERKAVRKRIVLSNNNALEVPGLQDLDKQNMVDHGIKGRVMGLPDELVGSLRTVEAFKVGQGWGYFRRPACLIRDEAVQLGRLMEEIERAPDDKDERVEGSGIKDYSGQTVRKLVHGERGVGKSVLLLQTMAMAFTRGWVVINFPEGECLQHWSQLYNYDTLSDRQTNNH